MLSEITLYHGDCLIEMNKIADKSVDMILCDLPYGTTANSWDIIIPFDKLWEQYNRVIKDNGAIVLFGSQPFITKLINSNIDNYKYSWYWVKNQGTNFFHAKHMPIRKVEEIAVFNNYLTYNAIESKGHEPTRSAKGSSNGKCYFGKNKRNYVGGSTERFPTDVLEFKCVNNYERNHPNQKPTDLLEYLIKTYTNENETVLDNCMGSGSTGVACINTKRNFIGIEKDEKYFEIAKDRINKAKESLFDI